MNINPALMHTIRRNPVQPTDAERHVNFALLHTIVREPKATVTAPEPTFEGKTADEWEAEARESMRRSAESWERSDTDGFLSQAASDAMAREYMLRADIARAGGKVEFMAIFDLDGNLIQMHRSEGQYGDYFYNRDHDINGAPRFIRPSQAKKGERRQATDEKKGFRVGTISATPEVKMTNTWGSYAALPASTTRDEITVVDNGTQGSQYTNWG